MHAERHLETETETETETTERQTHRHTVPGGEGIAHRSPARLQPESQGRLIRCVYTVKWVENELRRCVCVCGGGERERERER